MSNTMVMDWLCTIQTDRQQVTDMLRLRQAHTH
jgi:hypothetical protein